MSTPKEETIWKGSSSQILNFWFYALFGLCVLLVVPVFVFAPPYGVWACLVPLVALFVVLGKWIQVRSRVYEVTTERLRISQGILSKRTDELELYRVRDTTLFQPFFQRVFKLGNIIVNTTDTTTPVVTIQCVPQAAELRDRMRQAIETCRDRKRARVTELTGVADVEVDGDETSGH